tara:strand:- start:23 stop:262 length:240 start_codon:yes stop_codon:yes gene_type:complete
VQQVGANSSAAAEQERHVTARQAFELLEWENIFGQNKIHGRWQKSSHHQNKKEEIKRPNDKKQQLETTGSQVTHSRRSC